MNPSQIIDRGAQALYRNFWEGTSIPIPEWEQLDDETKEYWREDAQVVLASTELDLRIHFMQSTLNKVPPTALDYLANVSIHHGPIDTTFKKEDN